MLIIIIIITVAVAIVTMSTIISIIHEMSAATSDLLNLINLKKFSMRKNSASNICSIKLCLLNILVKKEWTNARRECLANFLLLFFFSFFQLKRKMSSIRSQKCFFYERTKKKWQTKFCLNVKWAVWKKKKIRCSNKSMEPKRDASSISRE